MCENVEGLYSAPVTKFVTHLTDSFSPYLHHLKPYVAMAMPSHPRIGILGSLIKGLPDLWPRLNDETAFGHFFDMTKNNLVIYIPDLMPGALVSWQALPKCKPPTPRSRWVAPLGCFSPHSTLPGKNHGIFPRHRTGNLLLALCLCTGH